MGVGGPLSGRGRTWAWQEVGVSWGGSGRGLNTPIVPLRNCKGGDVCLGGGGGGAGGGGGRSGSGRDRKWAWPEVGVASPVSPAGGEHLMEGELAVQVLLNGVQPTRVARLPLQLLGGGGGTRGPHTDPIGTHWDP